MLKQSSSKRQEKHRKRKKKLIEWILCYSKSSILDQENDISFFWYIDKYISYLFYNSVILR